MRGGDQGGKVRIRKENTALGVSAQVGAPPGPSREGRKWFRGGVGGTLSFHFMPSVFQAGERRKLQDMGKLHSTFASLC